MRSKLRRKGSPPLLELIFKAFSNGPMALALECWQYFSTALLDIMSMDFAYLKSHAPVVDEIMQILLAVGLGAPDRQSGFQASKYGGRAWL